jgi:hypothetical protein
MRLSPFQFPHRDWDFLRTSTDIAARRLRSRGCRARRDTLLGFPQLVRGRMMQSDHIDRTDLNRMADDGCPNNPTGDTQTHDLAELWVVLGKNDQTTG